MALEFSAACGFKTVRGNNDLVTGAKAAAMRIASAIPRKGRLIMLNIFDIVILDTIVNGERRWQQPAYYLPQPHVHRQKPRKPWSWLRLGTLDRRRRRGCRARASRQQIQTLDSVFTAVACGLDYSF